MPGCTRLSGACGGSLARACVFSHLSEISLQREQARAHTQYIGHLHLPPHSAAHRHLHSRLLTTAALLGWRSGALSAARRAPTAVRGAKQRHDKLATGFHPVGLRMMLESMWPILPPLARAFQCGARSCTQPRFSATHCPIQQSVVAEKSHEEGPFAGGSPTLHPHGSH